MENFNQNTRSFNNGDRQGGKFDGQKRRPRDRQKGMVQAFVQGKGQNAALKWLMDSKTAVCIFLSSGVKFEGLINAFDAFTISIVDVKRHVQMIYKDKISTITVKKPDAPAGHRPNPHFQNSDQERGVSRPSYGHRPVKTDDDGVTLPPKDLHSTY